MSLTVRYFGIAASSVVNVVVPSIFVTVFGPTVKFLALSVVLPCPLSLRPIVRLP